MRTVILRAQLKQKMRDPATRAAQRAARSSVVAQFPPPPAKPPSARETLHGVEHRPSRTVDPDSGVKNGNSRHSGTAAGQSALVAHGEAQN
jgi:hypothetical protein